MRDIKGFLPGLIYGEKRAPDALTEMDLDLLKTKPDHLTLDQYRL